MMDSFDAVPINGQAASGYALRRLPIDDEFTPTANLKRVKKTSKELSFFTVDFQDVSFSRWSRFNRRRNGQTFKSRV
jgi:hypothetical protein